MKLYLSSYGIGEKAEQLRSMIGGARRIGVIRNALDFSTETARLERRARSEHDELRALDLHPELLDLREYFENAPALADRLARLDALWVVGGNTFILRRAMARSGLDHLLPGLLRDNRFVYGGYSAGACVVTPTLRGIHLADDPDFIPPGYQAEIIWEGLGLVPFCIAPHYRSDHPESELIELSVQYFIDHGLPYITLSDGDAHIVDPSSGGVPES